MILDTLDRLNDDLASRGEDGEGASVANFNEVLDDLGSDWDNSAKYPAKISADLESISKW